MSRESQGSVRNAFFAIAAFAALGAEAQATLIGQNVTVTFQEPSFADVIDGVLVGAGSEISFLDGTNIGDEILLDFESIDIGASSILYNVQGEGPEHSPGFSTTGFDPAARFVFSDLTLASPSRIIAVNIILSNVIGVAAGSEVTFTDDSVALVIGTLGIGMIDGAPDVGSIRLDLTFEGINPSVPEPSLLGLLALSIAALGARRFGSRNS